MALPRLFAWVLLVGMSALNTSVVYCQNYPSKPIRLVTSEYGGTLDLMARLVAPGISGGLGQQVIVENRGGGVIPGETVARAVPDGYTLLAAAGSFWIGTLLRKAPYDVLRDFSPITLMTKATNILVVHPSLPAKSVKELINLAKARPGALNYSSPSIGSTGHLATELFKSMAGVDLVRIQYKGTAPALNALISGEAQIMFGSASSVLPYLKAGRLRALAVTGTEPSALAPGVPTVAGTGLPGYESLSIQGMFAPAKTPEALINRLNQEVVRVLSAADMKEKLLNVGIESVASSPEQFAAAIKSEMDRLGKVIKSAGIKAE